MGAASVGFQLAGHTQGYFGVARGLFAFADHRLGMGHGLGKRRAIFGRANAGGEFLLASGNISGLLFDTGHPDLMFAD